MAKATKRQPPSRVRYEQSHPTVSCRIPREVHDRLQAAKKSEAKSFADILKTGLGILELREKDTRKIRRQSRADGYKEGYAEGFAEAERFYKVTYPCCICGETMEITSIEAKQAASQFMQEHRWGHIACHERRR